MAQSQAGSPLMQCPYNGSHLILPLRMPGHLMKCRKNYPDVDLAVCPFNAVHEIPALELKHHMTECPDRNLLERDFADNALNRVCFNLQVERIKGNTDLPLPKEYPFQGQNLENWDDDEDEDRLIPISPRTQNSLENRISPQQNPSGRSSSRRSASRQHDDCQTNLRRPLTKAKVISSFSTKSSPSPTCFDGSHTQQAVPQGINGYSHLDSTHLATLIGTRHDPADRDSDSETVGSSGTPAHSSLTCASSADSRTKEDDRNTSELWSKSNNFPFGRGIGRGRGTFALSSVGIGRARLFQMLD